MHGGEKSGCSATEKALLLAYALKWRKRTNMLSAEQLRELEKEIWLSHIHAIVEETDESVSCVVPVGLMHVCSLSTSYPPPHSQSPPTKVGRSLGTRIPLRLPFLHVPTLATTRAHKSL